MKSPLHKLLASGAAACVALAIGCSESRTTAQSDEGSSPSTRDVTLVAKEETVNLKVNGMT